MRKILFILIAVFSFAQVKNDQYFIGVGAGKFKGNDSYTIFDMRIGYYFYDPNIYKINNRIYIEGYYIKDDNADKYLIGDIKLDWIKNNQIFSPFVGINTGISYYKNINTQTFGTWGFEVGVIANLTNAFEIEAAFTYRKPYEKRDAFKPQKIGTINLNISF
jgi:hypothetical protein